MGEMNGVNVSEMDMHEFAMFCKKCNERWNNPQTEGSVK